MTTQLIHDRGRGPEITGTRITVYTLLPHFLDPDATEAFICRLYELKAEQVAAARAYVLNNPDIVLSNDLRIEANLTTENPPEVVERAKATRATLLSFKNWLAQREDAEPQKQAAETGPKNGRTDSGRFPGFKQWLAEQESRPREGS